MHGETLGAPSLVIEDHGEIRLFEHSGDQAYSYRSLLLAGNDDLVTLKASDQGDNVTFMFESPKEDRISDFEVSFQFGTRAAGCTAFAH